MAPNDAVVSPPRTPAGDHDLTRPHGGSDSFLSRICRRAVLGYLGAVAEGELELVDGARRYRFGRATDEFPLRARLEVHSPDFYRRLAFGGSIGAAEAYAEGLWSTDDLTAVIRVLARKLATRRPAAGAASRLAVPLYRPFQRAFHLLRANTRRGARRNIAAHYDLGNDFFALFLDREMMYSCAVFPDEAADLDAASVHKLDLVCRKLELAPGDEVVEIGSGWGGFAVRAAREHGCRVTTTTISRRQYEHVRERVRREGLEDRIEVLLTDYRELPQVAARRFDKLVSIEMIEAVGHRFLPRYFEVVSELLRPDGMALIQAIVIADQRYETYRRSVDFIQRYIFPGGFVPSLGRIAECLKTRTDLRLFHLDDITPHYARTLAAWRRRFLDRREEVAALGFSDAFRRLWEFYFCYCEAGFAERTIGDVQLLLTKPLNRRQPLVAPA